MNNEEDRTEKKKEMCEDCGSTDLEANYERAEKSCKDCGLVTDYQEFGANDDQRHWGEEATATKVNTLGVTDKGSANGTRPLSKFEISKLSPGARRIYYRLRLMERGTVYNRHPFFGKVMREVEGLYGHNTAVGIEHLARMACTPLTPEQENVREGLKSCDRKRLAMPKQQICRQKDDLRGGDEESNARIIAIALAEIGGDFQITSKIDRRVDLQRYGLTDKQILSAKAIILKHYKARVGLKWAPIPRRINPSELRCDDVDQVIKHLDDSLSAKLSDAELDMVQTNAVYRLDLLREPGDDKVSPLTVNTNIRMVVACVFYAALQSLGLEEGLLNKVAMTCRLTGSGVSSRLEQFRNEDATGKLFVDGAFDDFIQL
jgi:hypothetical protein